MNAAGNFSVQIAAHVEALHKSLLLSSTSQGLGDWFVSRHYQPWLSATVEAERLRLIKYAALYDDFLPTSTREMSIRLPPRAGVGRVFAFDFWEMEYPCAMEQRVPPDVFGDGAKWLCGASLHPTPCRVLSLGSNFDDAFERSISAISTCTCHVVDPTIDHGGNGANKLRAFVEQLASYGASLNHSVGIGRPGGYLRFRGGTAPLVSLRTFIRDRYHSLRDSNGAIHISVLKVDIEGAEYDSLDELWEMCAEGTVSVDQLNVEAHMSDRRQPISALWALFAGARRCGLMLHHKEFNIWGKFPCAEFAWVSARHAERVVAAVARGMDG